jgi:hypothetical protein
MVRQQLFGMPRDQKTINPIVSYVPIVVILKLIVKV